MKASTIKAIPKKCMCAYREFIVRMINRIEKTISVMEIMILIPFNNGWRVKFNMAVTILTIEKAMLKAPNKTQNNVGSMPTKIKIRPNATIATAATAL